MPIQQYDVAIVGGGPGGSTTGTLLKKYRPDLDVAILEREVFPRDHVGESLLPPISPVLVEMGCWDAVEAADFPIKIGATYRWGKSPEPWDFEFIPGELFRDEPRPAAFEGQRQLTAFQVGRARYDEILLKRAAEVGCVVHQPTKVARVHASRDRVEHLELEDGSRIEAKYYVDASGHSGIVRRFLKIPVHYPTSLQNIAIWDYWQNADWAVEIGVGGTRVQVMSVGYGWIWFIPLGPTRTSVGLIVPVDHYKATGKRPEELYRLALGEDKRIVSLMANARSEGLLQTTSDWSFISERMCGENWFLVGESAGFADPILAAGLTMTHLGGREAASTILELLRGRHEPAWLREQFDRRQRERILTHIRFADYWYTANEQFTDLQDFTARLAKDVGLELSPEKAWAWIAQGGFINEDLLVGTGGFSLGFLKQSGEFLGALESGSPLERNNVFKLNLQSASWRERAFYPDGKVEPAQAYIRGGHVLPISGAIDLIVQVLQQRSKLADIVATFNSVGQKHANDPDFLSGMRLIPDAMEAMIHDGWIDASYDPSAPLIPLKQGATTLRWNKDQVV